MSGFGSCSFGFLFKLSALCSRFLFGRFFCPSSCLNWCLLVQIEMYTVTKAEMKYQNGWERREVSPGLPAPPTVPHPTKRRKPVGVRMRAVVEVGAHPVWRKLPQLLLLFCDRHRSSLSLHVCMSPSRAGNGVNAWDSIELVKENLSNTVFEELLERRADRRRFWRSRRSLLRVVLKPRRDGAWNKQSVTPTCSYHGLLTH